jgi:hypothetical protein
MTIFFIAAWTFVAGYYLGNVAGLKSANFDREAANNRLQDCIYVIEHNELKGN